MDAFLGTFEAVAMLLVIGIVGFWMVSRRLVDQNFFSLLSPLALEVALPALVFINIIENFDPEMNPGWWKLPLWLLFFVSITFAIVMIGMLLSKKENRSEFGLTLFYQNGLFFPLAVITGIFGADSKYTVDLFFMMMFYPAFFFNTYYLFFRRGKGELKWGKILHPVFIMTIVAIIIRLTGVHSFIPAFVTSGIRNVGNMAVPLLMLILGGNMLVDFKKLKRIRILQMLKFVSFKNVLIPIVVLSILYWIRPDFNIALILILEASVPPVTSAPLLAGREGGNRMLVNQYMVASFVFSLISIPFFIYIFSKLYPLP